MDLFDFWQWHILLFVLTFFKLKGKTLLLLQVIILEFTSV